jgi:toxin ParE1/3/4
MSWRRREPRLPLAMDKARLSRRAAQDLEDIYLNTDGLFGHYQAEAYLTGLERTIGLVADFPDIGLNASEIFPNLKRFRFQMHYVFYTIEPDHVFIRTIIHARQQLRRELFD